MSDMVFYLRRALEKQKLLRKKEQREYEKERDQRTREADDKQMRLHQMLIRQNTTIRDLKIQLGIKEGIEAHEQSTHL